MTEFIGVICGLKSEAQAVTASIDQSKIRIGISGANAQRAQEIAATFCVSGASAILSIGISGGLDPTLKPGDILIGDRVLADDGSIWSADSCLFGSLKDEIVDSAAAIGALFGADQIIESSEKKAELFQTYAALAVDMESHGAARAAANAGVPFLAIRAIADPANRALPSAALGAVAPDGSTRVLKTLGAALRDPKQFPALMTLGVDSAAATKTLRRDLGPLFRRLFLSLNL